jgi:threonine synthase
MQYLSTRGGVRPHGFLEAVEAGLAPDGGLFVPAELPNLGRRLAGWEELPYAELAAEFLAVFAPEIALEEWRALTAAAYGGFADPDVAPLVCLDRQTYVLELFHGPTLAFKDFALQLLGLLYKRLVAASGKRLTVLGATSGDTGSAAIHGCLGRAGIVIFILYPDGRVAPLQERQMACTGAANVFAMPVEGTFDDAQRVVKEVFRDHGFASEVNLVAVNSINIARVLAQCVYYLHAWRRLPAGVRDTVEFVVPTGNFGNVLAGWLLQRMGLPCGGFRVATNQNDILWRFFTTGTYEQREVQPSRAPSMDIQAASNFERYLYYVHGGDAVRTMAVMEAMGRGGRYDSGRVPEGTIRASRMEDEDIIPVIRSVQERYGYTVDPHTACGFTDLAGDRVSVILATASPAKFPETVAAATGVEPRHPFLEELRDRPLCRWPVTAEAGAVKAFLRAHGGVA